MCSSPFHVINFVFKSSSNTWDSANWFLNFPYTVLYKGRIWYDPTIPELICIVVQQYYANLWAQQKEIHDHSLLCVQITWHLEYSVNKKKCLLFDDLHLNYTLQLREYSFMHQRLQHMMKNWPMCSKNARCSRQMSPLFEWLFRVEVGIILLVISFPLTLTFMYVGKTWAH